MITNPVTTLANQPPMADFTACGEQAERGRSTPVPPPTPTAPWSSYPWDFGDGSPFVTTAEAEPQLRGVDTYNVTLTVTDNDGTTGTVTKPVTTVANASPTAVFSSSVNKLVVSFNAAGSSGLRWHGGVVRVGLR